jgi:branched-chain amino acid transport system permease protein
MLIVDLAIAGIGIGAVAALAGLGLLVTYQLTGVFNLAFGAIAMMSAYLVWWLVRVQHWPVGIAAAVVLLVGCPTLGLLLDRVVFRPLQRRDHSPAETLTATVGVFVLLVGAAFTIWGGQARTDAPALVSGRVLSLPGDTVVRYETLADLTVVLAVALLLALMLRTRPGLNLRAAVARRELAQLAGIDTDRISVVGWVAGSVLAGVSGILLAPSLRLDPYTLTLLVLETMAVAVIARLAHPGVAIAAALAIGIAQSELTQFHLSGRAGALLQASGTNLFVVVLLGALLVIRRFVGSSDDAASTSPLAVRREYPTPRGWWIPALALLAVPLVLSQESLITAQQVPALAIILVSIVVLSGYGGQISFGTAGFAGLGALLTAHLSRGALSSFPRVGDLLAFPVGALLVVPVGLLTGWPAIRRRGLFLALTTFAVGAMVSRFVFEQPAFVTGVVSGPPELFRTDHNFYVFELVCLGGALVLVRNLHRGRLGRALLAMRDDEAGARAVGVDVTRLKVFLFATSALIAGLGGALLASSARAFDSGSFDPVQSLLWFATVVVFGVDSATGAVLGAAVLVTLDATVRPGISTLAVGATAVMLGRIPGGALYWIRRATFSLFRTAGPADPERPDVRLSAAGLQLVERLRR